MEATIRNNYLMMVLYLMNKISNMRQGINEDNQVAKIYPDILEQITAEIKNTYSLDISCLKDKNEMLQAEELLGKLVSSIINNELTPSIADETQLVKDSVDLNPDELATTTFLIADGLKSYLKSMGISNADYIKPWFNKLDYCRYFKILDSQNILATKRISLNGVSKILFAHIIIHVDDKREIVQYEVTNLAIVNYIRFKDMFTSPVRLFLYLLDEYGLDINYNGKVKKLFYKEEITDENATISWSSKSKLLSAGIQNIKDKENNKNYLIFVYGFDYENILEDYKSKAI